MICPCSASPYPDAKIMVEIQAPANMRENGTVQFDMDRDKGLN